MDQKTTEDSHYNFNITTSTSAISVPSKQLRRFLEWKASLKLHSLKLQVCDIYVVNLYI